MAWCALIGIVGLSAGVRLWSRPGGLGQAMGASGVWACRREAPSGVGGRGAVRGGAGTGDRCERMTKASGEQPGASPTIVHDS